MNELVREWVEKAEGDVRTAATDESAAKAIEIMRQLRTYLRRLLDLDRSA